MTTPNLTAAHSAVYDMETPIRESQVRTEVRTPTRARSVPQSSPRYSPNRNRFPQSR